MDIDLPELSFPFSPDFIPFLQICDGVPVNMHSLTLLVSGEWFRTGIENSSHFGRAHTLPNDWFVVDLTP